MTASGLAVGGGLYAGGVLTTGEVYDLSVAEARSRLMTVSLPRDVLVTAGGSDAADVDMDVLSDSISWEVSRGGKRAARFTANLRPEGPMRTRVTIDYANDRSPSSYADRLLSTKFLRSYVETSFAEEVDARLEARPADRDRALTEFANHVAADPEIVRELGLTTEGMFRGIGAQARANAVAPARIFMIRSRPARPCARPPVLR